MEQLSFLSEKIKYLRRKLGYSQAELAAYLCISQSAYAKLENGQTVLNLKHLLLISDFLKVSPNELLTQDETLTSEDVDKRELTEESHLERLALIKSKDEQIELLKEEIRFLREQLSDRLKS